MHKLVWGLVALGLMGMGSLAVAKEDKSTRAAYEQRKAADQRTNQYRSEQRRDTQRHTERRTETRRTESTSSYNKRR